MKKILFFICLLSLFFIGCNEPDNPVDGEGNDSFIAECEKLIPAGETIKEDITFLKEIIIDNVWVDFTYISSNQNILSNDGKVTLPEEEDTAVSVVVKYSFYQKDGTRYESEGKTITYIVVSGKTILKEASEKINIPSVIKDDIELPVEVDGFEIQWSSSERCLSDRGKYKYVSEPVDVTLTATFIYEAAEKVYFYDKEYNVVVAPYEDQKCVELVAAKITMPETVSGYKLPYVTENDYDVTINWSCDNSVIDENGVISKLASDIEVSVTAEISKGDAKVTLTFDVLVKYYEITHNLVIETESFDGEFSNTEIVDGYLVLTSGSLEGTYVSNEYNVRDFTEVVGSWNALTNKEEATCEYAISVYANDTWSKYFSYGEWGLGRNNLYYNQNDTYVKMNTDEILVNSNYVGTKVKFMVTLRRTDAAVTSPKLARVAMTFVYENYSYPVDVTNLPESADWDVPKLYQYDVPEIGGSICSATTTTMLLKYHGVDVSSDYDFEHEYMASLVADRGHNNPTYGNWSFNMATAGAFGRKAYVARMYSFDELREYLATTGPVGASIKGTFTSINGSSYTTNGHLIVVRGYRIVNGQTIVICNDPAVKGTYYEVYLSTFLNCWRNVIYIVE